jgi:hypothetical protein
LKQIEIACRRWQVIATQIDHLVSELQQELDGCLTEPNGLSEESLTSLSQSQFHRSYTIKLYCDAANRLADLLGR